MTSTSIDYSKSSWPL